MDRHAVKIIANSIRVYIYVEHYMLKSLDDQELEAFGIVPFSTDFEGLDYMLRCQ